MLFFIGWGFGDGLLTLCAERSWWLGMRRLWQRRVRSNRGMEDHKIMPTIEPCDRLVVVKCTFIHSGVWERGHLHRSWWHPDGMYVARRIALIYSVSIDSSARCVILHMPWSRGAQIGVTSGRLCFGPKIVGWSFLYKSLWHGGVI